MKTLPGLSLIILLATTGLATAEERETAADPRAGVWGLDAEATSATLARGGWKYLGVAAMSWPDGRQALVTMWNSPIGDFARCFDYFDAAMNQTGSKCERSGTGL